jgi:hypothetical protein
VRSPLKKTGLIVAAIVLFGLIGAARAQTIPADIGIQDVYLARDDGSGQAGEAATEFSTTDIPIYCVVLLDSPKKASVKMNLVAVSVAGVKPETKVVTTSFTTTDEQDRVNFTGRPAGLWTQGKYRVDVYLDGKFATKVPFEIRNPAPISGSAEMFVPKKEARPKPQKPRDN